MLIIIRYNLIRICLRQECSEYLWACISPFWSFVRLACLMKPHHAKLDRPSGLRKRSQKDRYTVNDKNDTEWQGSTSLVTSQQSGVGAWVGKPELPNCRARKAIRQSRVRDMKIEENLVSFCDVIGVKGIQSDVSSNWLACIKGIWLFRSSFCVFGLVWRMWGIKTVRGTKAFSWVMSRRALRDPHCVWQPCCRLHCSALDDSAWGSGFCSSSVGPDIPTKSYKARLMFRS